MFGFKQQNASHTQGEDDYLTASSQVKDGLNPVAEDAHDLVDVTEGESPSDLEAAAAKHDMTGRQLKKLSRVQLLEIMVDQAKTIDDLTAQLEQAENQVKAQRVALQQIAAVSQTSLGIDVNAQTAQEAITKYTDELDRLNTPGATTEEVPPATPAIIEEEDQEQPARGKHASHTQIDLSPLNEFDNDRFDGDSFPEDTVR